jgi:hypothetical protein
MKGRALVSDASQKRPSRSTLLRSVANHSAKATKSLSTGIALVEIRYNVRGDIDS